MKKIFKIEVMGCNHCVISVQKQLSALELVKFKVEIGSAEIDYDEKKIKEKEIHKAIENAGYKVIN